MSWKSVTALALVVSLITFIYLDILHLHVAVSMSVISGISTAISFFIAIFLLVYQAGLALLDPFEGEPNDTPMSSIVRTIEINLLEQIGDKNLPDPVEPVDGRYLM